MSLEEEATHCIVDGAYHPLRFSVLLRSVRTRETEGDTLLCEVVMELSVVILASIVALKRFYVPAKLSFSHSL